MGCTGPKDCPRGQDCTNGRCTSTAVDELADTEPAPKIEHTEETPCDE
jgi:hypothetical protein